MNRRKFFSVRDKDIKIGHIGLRETEAKRNGKTRDNYKQIAESCNLRKITVDADMMSITVDKVEVQDRTPASQSIQHHHLRRRWP